MLRHQESLRSTEFPYYFSFFRMFLEKFGETRDNCGDCDKDEPSCRSAILYVRLLRRRQGQDCGGVSRRWPGRGGEAL